MKRKEMNAESVTESKGEKLRKKKKKKKKKKDEDGISERNGEKLKRRNARSAKEMARSRGKMHAKSVKATVGPRRK
jgi:hypothetical protein